MVSPFLFDFEEVVGMVGDDPADLVEHDVHVAHFGARADFLHFILPSKTEAEPLAGSAISCHSKLTFSCQAGGGFPASEGTVQVLVVRGWRRWRR